jgi:hypothetical protein
MMVDYRKHVAGLLLSPMNEISIDDFNSSRRIVELAKEISLLYV